MKLAIIAALVFLMGIVPGLVKSEGQIQEAQRVHRGTPAAEAHPALVRMASVLKIRF